MRGIGTTVHSLEIPDRPTTQILMDAVVFTKHMQKKHWFICIKFSCSVHLKACRGKNKKSAMLRINKLANIASSGLPFLRREIQERKPAKSCWSSEAAVRVINKQYWRQGSLLLNSPKDRWMLSIFPGNLIERGQPPLRSTKIPLSAL